MAGLRVLCIDNGGVRGLFALRILRDLKDRTNKEPHELFDLICGVGTGGIIALLLGVLKMPVDRCMRLCKILDQDVFKPNSWRKSKYTGDDPVVYRSITLDNHMKKTIADFAGGDAELRL